MAQFLNLETRGFNVSLVRQYTVNADGTVTIAFDATHVVRLQANESAVFLTEVGGQTEGGAKPASHWGGVIK